MIPQPLNLQHLAQAKALNASMWQLAEMSTIKPATPPIAQILQTNLAAGCTLHYVGHDGLRTYWYLRNPVNKTDSPNFAVSNDDPEAWAIVRPTYIEWRKYSGGAA